MSDPGSDSLPGVARWNYFRDGGHKCAARAWRFLQTVTVIKTTIIPMPLVIETGAIEGGDQESWIPGPRARLRSCVANHTDRI